MPSHSPSMQMKGSHNTFLFHGIKTLKPNHPDVKQLHRNGLDKKCLGSIIWHASYLLVDYLSTLNFSDDQHFLELGCGWGLASTYIKKTFDAKVTATDRDTNALALQQLLSSNNKVTVNTQQLSFADLMQQDISRFHIMIGAEICYSESTAYQLEQLIEQFSSQGGNAVILADRGCNTFLTLARKLTKRYSSQLQKISLTQPVTTSGYLLHIRLNND